MRIILKKDKNKLGTLILMWSKKKGFTKVEFYLNSESITKVCFLYLFVFLCDKNLYSSKGDKILKKKK